MTRWTGSDSPSQIWTMVELGTGTLSVCLPTMRPLFSRLKSHPGTAQEQHDTCDEAQGTGSPRARPSISTMRTVGTIPKPSHSPSFTHLGVLGGEIEELFAQDITEKRAKTAPINKIMIKDLPGANTFSSHP